MLTPRVTGSVVGVWPPPGPLGAAEEQACDSAPEPLLKGEGKDRARRAAALSGILRAAVGKAGGRVLLLEGQASPFQVPFLWAQVGQQGGSLGRAWQAPEQWWGERAAPQEGGQHAPARGGEEDRRGWAPEDFQEQVVDCRVRGGSPQSSSE